MFFPTSLRRTFSAFRWTPPFTWPLCVTVVLAMVLAVLSASVCHAQGKTILKMVGGGSSPLVEPEGFFSLLLPGGFDCELRSRRADCSGTRGQAKLTIAVRDVPWSATANLAALNEMDNFKKKQHFKLNKREAILISGKKALAQSFTYDHFGNVEYSTWVQAYYLVQKNKLYVIHFEARSAIATKYARDLSKILMTFRVTPLDDGGHPDLDQLLLPKKKNKRLKATRHGF